LVKVGLESDNPTTLSDGKRLLAQSKIKPHELFGLLELQTQLRQKGFIRSLEQLAAERHASSNVVLECAA